MTDTSISGTQASNQLPSGASNGQIPIWNSSTLRWEAGANGGFDPTAAITFSGVVTFSNYVNVDYTYFTLTDGIKQVKFHIANIAFSDAVAYFPSNWATNIFAATDLNNNFSAAQTFAENINANKALIIAASAGNGYIQMGRQSANPSGVASNLSIFADASNRLSFREGTGSIATFSNANLGSNAVFSFPNVASGTLATIDNAQTFTARQSIVIANSNGVTDLLINPSVKTSGNLIDAQVNSTSVFSITNAGLLTAAGNINTTTGVYYFANSQFISGTQYGSTIFYRSNGNGHRFNVNGGTDALTLLNSGASSASVLLSQTPYRGGDGTSNYPLFYINNSANNPSTWDFTTTNGGTYLGINAVASFAGNFLDFHVNGAASVFKVAGTGELTARSAVFTSDLIAGINAKLGWTGRGYLTAFSDGIFTLYNNAGDNFIRLQFGGNTSAYPALKRNAATIEFVKADESGYASIKANIGVFSTLQVTSPDYGGVSTTVISSSTGATLITLADKSATMAASSIFITAASTEAGSGFRLTQGLAPTSPQDGDMWCKTDRTVYIRVGGVTKQFTLI